MIYSNIQSTHIQINMNSTITTSTTIKYHIIYSHALRNHDLLQAQYIGENKTSLLIWNMP